MLKGQIHDEHRRMRLRERGRYGRAACSAHKAASCRRRQLQGSAGSRRPRCRAKTSAEAQLTVRPERLHRLAPLLTTKHYVTSTRSRPGTNGSAGSAGTRARGGVQTAAGAGAGVMHSRPNSSRGTFQALIEAGRGAAYWTPWKRWSGAASRAAREVEQAQLNPTGPRTRAI